MKRARGASSAEVGTLLVNKFSTAISCCAAHCKGYLIIVLDCRHHDFFVRINNFCIIVCCYCYAEKLIKARLADGGIFIYCVACELFIIAISRNLCSLLSSNHIVSSNSTQKVKRKKEELKHEER